MWVVVNIGCIECGVSTAIVGVFSDHAKAGAIAEELAGIKAMRWREGGQNEYEVFEMPKADVVAEEYQEHLSP